MAITLVVVICCAATSALTAQGGARGVSIGPDPYTRGDLAAIERAGYTSMGPMDWARSHDTAAIVKVVGQLPFAWIETEHFRIGCTLPRMRVEGSARKRVRAELKRLGKKLRGVKPGAREQDRWLRAHLYAQRCEDVWTEFEQRFGAPGWDAPKLLVLLLESEGTLARYATKFLGQRRLGPTRMNLDDRVMFFGVSADRGNRHDDTVLHCSLAYNLAVNLVTTWGEGKHSVPAWWTSGLGNWFGRRIDPRYNSYEEVNYAVPDAKRIDAWQWGPRVLRLVKNGGAPDVPELLRERDVADFRYRDFLIAWSLVDFLLSDFADGPEGFLRKMKEPLWSGRGAAEGVLARQQAALAAAFDLDAEGLESAWREFVRKRYRSRKH